MTKEEGECVFDNHHDDHPIVKPFRRGILRGDGLMDLGDLEQLFAEVAAFEQAHQGRRRVLEAVLDVGAGFDLSGAQPLGQPRIGQRVVPLVMRHQESLDGRAGEDDVEIVARPRRHLAGIARIGVIAGDAAADDHARAEDEARQAIVQHIAADIVDVVCTT